MQLTVYKASAGSGKTFRLAVEYIKLMIKNPVCAHRGILAVTFTNKATEEMKVRIMSQLYGIWKSLPDSRGYLERVCEELRMPPAEVSRRAGIALSNLIHDFDHFRVETIDKFFQRVLRNLAHELGLAANLRVGLNDPQVEELAVDQLIEQLSEKDKELGWIIDYISRNISENKNWNVTRSIKSFGKTIFKDAYKEKRDDINSVVSNEESFREFFESMHKIIAAFEREMASYEPRYMKILDENGIAASDLSKTMGGYFAKLKDKSKYRMKDLRLKTYVAALDDPSLWVTKAVAKKRPDLLGIAENLLAPLHREADETVLKGLPRYNTARMSLTYINQLRLLSAIERKVGEVNANANRFLLSDTQQLLAQFVKDNDSPFIYEKIGTQVNHIMIDEFQDTSTVQWANFLVLLRDCMSRSNPSVSDVAQNLIVGDVKQSIYRWRSGDWQLLNNIEQKFNPEELKVEPMKHNYRSSKNIIRFNNAFFEVAVAIETDNEREVCGDRAEELAKAYSDVRQEIPERNGDGGEVRITLLPAADNKELTLDTIVETVDMMLSRGVGQPQIAILLRNNKEIRLIAEKFMQVRPDVRLVSDEAFRLDASLAVNMIIESLTLLLHPEDLLTRATIAKQYQENIAASGLKEGPMLSEATEEKINRLLPEAFVNGFAQMAEMPLMDLIEYIYNVLELCRLSEQSAYVCAFYDAVGEFAGDCSPGIEALLQHWDEQLHKNNIQSDEINGIRLLTIHKSKGLEYDNVIVPFVNWDIHKSDMIWCTTNEEPFSQMPLIPVKCVKEMNESYFAGDYQHEHLQTTVDNMNLLYVAFTRAKNNLYVIGQNGGKSGRSALIAQSIDGVAAKLDGATTEEDNGTLRFAFGTFKTGEEKERDQTSNVFLQDTKKVTVAVETFPVPINFRQSNQSIEFTLDEDDEAMQRSTYIKRGNILHNIFSKINTKDDVKRVLREMEQDGILYDEVTRDDLFASINKCLSNPVASEWFSGRWKTFRECTILETVDGRTREHRPDRVMTDGTETVVVDYKFGTPKTAHEDQINRYMRLLDDMGHENIRGYLWYVDSNLIKEFTSLLSR